MTDNHQDTICAIATAAGGAIGIVRVSGPEAISIVGRVFRPAREGAALSDRPAYSIAFGTLLDAHGQALDQVLAAVFRAPHSYTGEDSVELSCHGSKYILQTALQTLVDAGCRLAQPGEFTRRAFANGKMDLSQAEAVADLIASSSAASHRLAMDQMRGGFSRELAKLRDQLLEFTALIELELDFSDHEDLEFADRSKLQDLAAKIDDKIDGLARSFKVGNVLKNGIPVAIIGPTNVGKSTLLNALLNEERSIVSDIGGTTRDTVEDVLTIDGVEFRFIDTAGIRRTTDVVENMGIDRTFHKIDQASVVLWLADATQAAEQVAALAPQVLPRCEGKDLVLVLNKSDLEPSPTLPAGLLPDGTHVVHISAKQGTGLDALRKLLPELAGIPESQSGVIVTNVRHYEALTHALDAIRRVRKGLADGISGDLLSQDIRECIFYLNDIVGEVTTDDVLGHIFSHFCVGK